jgi:hypothetical protein
MDLFPSKVKRENAQDNGAGPPVHAAIFLKEIDWIPPCGGVPECGDWVANKHLNSRSGESEAIFRLHETQILFSCPLVNV